MFNFNALKYFIRIFGHAFNSFFFFKLADTKTADRKISLLHYIADTVKTKFPQVSNFENELLFIEKAASGILYNFCFNGICVD